MEKSRFATLKSGKKVHIQGWKKDVHDPRDFMLKTPMFVSWRLPSSFNLRANCPRVEDQGGVGSCTANASTSACEYLYKKLGKELPQLSRLFLYYYSRKYEGTPPTEDSGAQIRDVMKVLALTGVCHEDIWPYDEMMYSVEPPPLTLVEAKNHLVQFYYRCPNLKTIKASISQGFPVVGGFLVPESMFSDETSISGVVKFPELGEKIVGGHAVLFVGYDDEKKRLCFQNSWGPGWGDAGFGYLPYKYVDLWLADDFWTIRQELMK